MYRVLDSPVDKLMFQRDLDKIPDWREVNRLRINTRKCKIMTITKKRNPAVRVYCINGQTLECVQLYKVLSTGHKHWNALRMYCCKG